MSALELGLILRPHGLRGEVKVRLHWAESEALAAGRRVAVVAPGKAPAELEVEGVRGGPSGLIVKLRGVGDRNAAEALRGARVMIPREELAPLAPDELYLVDLIGFTVTAPDGPVGRVVDVSAHATVDSLVIEGEEGRRFEQPLLDAWIESVDAEERRVALRSRDGLID